jgi:uncharacterized protein YjdB
MGKRFIADMSNDDYSVKEGRMTKGCKALLFLVLLVSIALSACGSIFGSSVATGISLNKETFPIIIGETVKLIATITPSGAADTEITWSSSDITKATVDAYGNVKGIAAGNAIITAATSDGLVKDECGVIVTAGYPVTDISLNKNTYSMHVGESFQFVATILPSFASDQNITWSSTNTAVVLPLTNEAGKVVALTAGTATIKVETSNHKIAQCIITVTL